MPRQARLDAPGTLHHVMVRGGYFSTVLGRCLETLGQFLNLGPEFREYLGAIFTAFKQITSSQGCQN